MSIDFLNFFKFSPICSLSLIFKLGDKPLDKYLECYIMVLDLCIISVLYAFF